MKYKVGDKVRIRKDLAEYTNMAKKRAWAGKTMTITAADENNKYYGMLEDNFEFSWYEDMIEGPAKPEMSDDEVLRLAIDTYGEDEQIRVCQEEMNDFVKIS